MWLAKSAFSLSRNICLNTLVKLLSRIIAHLLLSVVDSSRLNDNCQITSRPNRKRMADDLIAKIFRVFLVKSQTVVFLDRKSVV